MSEERIRSLPIWQGHIEIAPLKGGLSNESFTVTDAKGKYVARFGRDFPFHHVFRDREVMAARAAHAAGFAPEVVHAQPGVMVSRFVDGTTYGSAEVQANIPRIAEIVRRFHDEMAAHVSGPGFIFWVFHVIRDYARTLAAGGSRMATRIPGFLALAAEMEAVQVPLPIVYGHHDFLPANFIDDGSRLWIIDFEYAGFGTAMFDLAGIASNAGFDGRQSEALIEAYLGRMPDDAFRRSHAAMQCASLLREAMWSMVSELYLDAPGADYVAYTQENLDALQVSVEAFRASY